MKFVIENISKSSGRLGTFVHLETGNKFKTPLLLQTTKGGSIPYLSRDVFDVISKEPQILQVSLANVGHMAESVGSLKTDFSSYVGFKNYPIMLTVRDPCEYMPSGFNDKDVVPLFTRRGKEQLSAKRYMKMASQLAPNLYQGLSDVDTNLESTNKRVQKSVDRTEQFVNSCLEEHAATTEQKNSQCFAPIVGGYNSFARTNSIKHIKQKGEDAFAGFILEGFHQYGVTATEVDNDKVLDIVKHCLDQLNTDLPKMMPGAYTPLLMLQLVRLGVDMFDTSYAYCATKNFKALTFNFRLNTQSDSAEATPFLDLTDEKWKEEFTPILQECSCLACREHTRAYIYHLYQTRELLGSILLMIHNLHHMMQFFEIIRNSICNDTLPALTQLLQFQGTDSNIDYRISENLQLKSKTSFGRATIEDDS